MVIEKGIRYGDRTKPAGKFLTFENFKEENPNIHKKPFLSTFDMIATSSINI